MRLAPSSPHRLACHFSRKKCLPFKKYCFCFSEDSQDGYHVSGMESIHNLHCAFNSSGVEANEVDREAWGESSMDLSLVDLCDDFMSGNIVRQLVLVCFVHVFFQQMLSRVSFTFTAGAQNVLK